MSADDRSIELFGQAAQFDQAALEHLGNKGLVRRAVKLLSTAAATIDERDDGVAVVGSDWEVFFAWGAAVADGRCGCATAGVCQHLIAAVMRLAEQALGSEASDEDDVSPTEEADSAADHPSGAILAGLLAVTDEELRSWAKKADTQWALARAASIELADVVVGGDRYVAIDLPTPHAGVRFMSTDLDAAMVKPSTRHDRRAAALALVALWRLHGREVEVAPEAAGSATGNELPSERLAVVNRASKICGDLLVVGLLHVGDSERERLNSLAASARGVKLYRLAVLAERTADVVDALTAQSPDADTERVLDVASELAVVAGALRNHLEHHRPLPDGLAGTARARYDVVGQLDLACIGHYTWGNHGFAGVTGVFAESATRCFTLSRPTFVNGRSLSEAAGWAGAGSVASLVGQRVLLSGALASAELRLSGSEKVAASIGSHLTAGDFESLAWDGEQPTPPSRLLGRVGSRWAVVPIDAESAPLAFDPVTQTTVWPLVAGQRVIEFRLRYRLATAEAVSRFEAQATLGPPDQIVARLSSGAGGIVGWPIGVVRSGQLSNLFGSSAIAASQVAGVEAAVVDAPPGKESHLERIGSRLARLAESGRRPGLGDELADLARGADLWGFPVIRDVINAAPDHGAAMLRAAWVLRSLEDHDT